MSLSCFRLGGAPSGSTGRFLGVSYKMGVPTHAFTLVELLVVIAIMGVLISLVLSGLSSARERGRGVACAARLRTIGQGFMGYMADNQMYFPKLHGGDGTGLWPAPYWTHNILPYIDNSYRLEPPYDPVQESRVYR